MCIQFTCDCTCIGTRFCTHAVYAYMWAHACLRDSHYFNNFIHSFIHSFVHECPCVRVCPSSAIGITDSTSSSFPRALLTRPSVHSQLYVFLSPNFARIWHLDSSVLGLVLAGIWSLSFWQQSMFGNLMYFQWRALTTKQPTKQSSQPIN